MIHLAGSALRRALVALTPRTPHALLAGSLSKAAGTADLKVHGVGALGVARAGVGGVARQPLPLVADSGAAAAGVVAATEDLFVHVLVAVVVDVIAELFHGGRRRAPLEGALNTGLYPLAALCPAGSLRAVLTIIAAVINGAVAVFVEVIAADLHAHPGGRTAPPLAADAALVAGAALCGALPLLAVDAAPAFFVGAAVAVVIPTVSTHLRGRGARVAGPPHAAAAGLIAVSALGGTGALVSLVAVVDQTLPIDAATAGTVGVHAAAFTGHHAAGAQTLLAGGTGTPVTTADHEASSGVALESGGAGPSG